MNNARGEANAETSQFPPITQDDLKRLRGIIRDNESSTIDAKEFAEIHADLVKRFIREFFDCPEIMRAKSRRSRLESTKPHLSLIGHVTPEGLRNSLKTVEVFNGMANRLMFIASRRTRSVPRPPVVDWSDGRPAVIVKYLKDVFGKFHPKNESIKNPQFEFEFTDEAALKWDEIYYRLEKEYDGQTGLHGAIVARWKPFILRLSIIYAALDLSQEITVEHLEAAEALWRYAAGSAIWAFGLNSGNPNVDKILKHLSRRTIGANKTEIRQKCFNNHIPAADLDEALSFLKNSGYIRHGERGQARTMVQGLTCAFAQVCAQNTAQYNPLGMRGLLRF